MRRQSFPRIAEKTCCPIGIYIAEDGLEHEAQSLAARTELPIIGSLSQLKTALILNRNGLSLARPGDVTLKGAVQVDFTTGAWIRRIKRVREERLIRAMGKKTPKAATIIDVTGGLGRDGFLLAASGFQVRIFERNRILAALLADGLARASETAATGEICRRIRFTPGDAIDLLHSDVMAADIIYLDPMFPGTSSTAKVKKELQMIRQITGEDPDIDELFARTLQQAQERVVVKRPQKGPWLGGLRPSYSLKGTAIRFDIYLSGHIVS